MELLPAIDIIDGRAVRLYQGDYAQMTTFPGAVPDIARRMVDEGAGWLHIVDLDGARAGRPANTELIMEVRRAVDIHIEVGGGLRTAAQVDTLLDGGIDRIILGTAALADDALLDYLLARNPATLAVALDARAGIVATSGWLAGSGRRVEEVAATLAERGVRVFSHTDIAHDGTLGGPNYAALSEVLATLQRTATTPGPQLIASGGITTTDHLRILRRMGLAGAIVGRALYTGDLSLPAALTAARGEDTDP